MSSVANDPIDLIMDVMAIAFDPAYGEAWNRRQVSDALVMPNSHYLLLGPDLEPPEEGTPAAGFLLSRQALDEEELLLIAVRPEFRRNGVASALIGRFVAAARRRGVKRLFLEMRDGNQAAELYFRQQFVPVGRRRGYYNRGRIRGIDAITFARDI